MLSGVAVVWAILLLFVILFLIPGDRDSIDLDDFYDEEDDNEIDPDSKI